jgi:hypothetical protein
MNRLLAVSVAACLMPAVAGAGEVFGTIKGAGGPVGGAEVTAKCGANAYGPAKTDKKGTYRLVINQTGKCTLTVTHDGKSATLDVVSFEDAAQSDVALAVDAAGKLTAKRG